MDSLWEAAPHCRGAKKVVFARSELSAASTLLPAVSSSSSSNYDYGPFFDVEPFSPR
jgi:hypothetical protein